MPEDKIKALYDAVGEKYSVGTLDEFKVKLQDETKRKAFYEAVSSEYDLGDFNSFSEKVKKKDQSSPVSSTPYHLQPSTSGKPISPAQNFDAYLKDELNHFPGIPAPTPQPQQRQPLDPSLRGDLYSQKESVITAGGDPKKAPVTGKDLTMKEANEISKKIGQATEEMKRARLEKITGEKMPELSPSKEPEPAVDIEMLKKVNPQFKEDWEKQQKDTKINQYMLIQAANDPEKIDDWAAKKKAGLSQEEEYRILSEINLADIENKKQDDEILKARLTEIETEGSLGQSQGELVKIRDGIKALQPDLEKQKVAVGKLKTRIDQANQEIQPYVATIQKLAPVIKELNDRAVSEGERINAFEKMGPMTPTQIAEYKATIDNYNKIVTEIQSHKEYFEAEGKIKELQAKNAPLFDSYSKAVDKLNGTLDQVNQAGDQYNQILEEMDKNGYMEQYSKTFAELEENSAGYEKVAAEQNALIKKYPEVYKKQMDQDVANLMYEVAKHQGGAKFSDALMQESVKRAYNFTVNGVASALIALNHTVERPIATALGIGKTDAAMNAINTVVDNLIVTVPDKKIYNGETGEIDPWRIIPYAAEQAANIYMLVQGGGLLGGGTKGLVTTAYLTQYESVRKEAVAAGLSNNDAIMYAMPVAAGMALLEVIMPDSNLVFGSKKMLAEFAKNVGKNRNLAFKSVMDQLKKVLMENFEEFSQSAYQKFANVATNQMMGTKMETQINTEETINTAFITTPVSFFAGAGNIRLSHNREQNYQVAQMAMNPDLTAKAIQENVDAGILTPEEAEGLQEKVKKYEGIVAGMPPNLSTEKKVQVAPIIEEINDLEAEKEGLSEQFAKLKEEEIKAKEKEFKAAMGVTEAKPQGADNTDGLSEERTAQEESTPVEVGKETKQETPPVAEKVPAPAPVTTESTTNGKETKRRKKGRKDVLTPDQETASSEAVSPVKKTEVAGKTKFFHASNKPITGKLQPNEARQFGSGVYFSTNQELVKEEFGENVTEVELNLENPVKTNTPEWTKVRELAIKKADDDYGKKNNLTLGEDDTYFKYDSQNIDEWYEIPAKFISEAAKELGHDAIIDEGSNTYENEIMVIDDSKIIYSDSKPAPTSATMTQAEKDKNNAEAEKLGWKNVPQALASIKKRTGTDYKAWEDVPAEVRTGISKQRDPNAPTMVADEKGQPITVYRSQEDDRKQGSQRQSKHYGIYFSQNKESTKIYGDKTKAYNVDLKNPKILKDTAWNLSVIPEHLYKQMKAEGYDGAIWMRKGEMYEVVAFDESQVKEVAEPSSKETATPKAKPAPAADKTPSKLDAAKERMKAAKAKLKPQGLGIANDPKQKAKDLFEYHASLVEVAKESIIAGIKTGKEFAASIGEKFTKKIKDAWIEAKGGPAKTEDDFIPPVAPPEPKKEKEGPERKKRRFTKQIQKSKDIPKEIKDWITDDQINYTVIPNEVTASEANSLIDYLGEDRAAITIMDSSNGISGAVRVMAGHILLKRLSQMGEYDTVATLLNFLVKRGTAAGQEVQSFAAFGFITPEGALRYAERDMDEQRKKRAKRDKPKTDKILKGMKKVNKETIDEVLEKPEIKKKVEKVQTVTPKVAPVSYGSSNKVVTKQRYSELLAKVRGKLFTNPLDPVVIEIAAYHLEASGRKFGDFTKNMIRDFGSKVKPYLKDIYDAAKEKLKGEYTDFDSDSSVNEAAAKLNTDHLVTAMGKAIARGNKKEMDKAIAALQKVSKDEGLWGKYKKLAVKRLETIAMKDLASDIKSSPILEEFTNGLIKNIQQQIPAEQGPVPAKKSKPAIEIIADAFKNFEKYADVWTDTMEAIKEKYKDNPQLLEDLDVYFGEILAKPFSEKLVQEAVKTGMKDLGQDLAEIVKSHYTVYDHAKETLRHKLMNQARLTEEEAGELADAIRDEFDRIATAKKQQLLNKMFSTKERKKPDVKTLEGEIIKLTNLGAFYNPEILEKYADKMGYPKLSAENIQKIEQLATKIQHAPDGLKKFRAIEDLLTYQAKIKGVNWWDISLAVWFANILSGPTTQLVNAAGSAYNSMFLGLNIGLQQTVYGSKGVSTAKGFYVGFMHGISEGKEVLRTGYNPIRENKVEVPPILEYFTFSGGKKNPANYLKYVRRLMVAADTLFFEAQREMRAYQYANKQAMEEGRLEPTLNHKNRALEILNQNDNSLEAARQKADSEYKSDVSEINGDLNLTQKEKEEKIAQAGRDINRRVYEIMQQGREEKLLKQAHTYASKGTYNYPPMGFLGMISHGINAVTSLPYASGLKLLVPFTNIIANVVNEKLNYTPLGHIRAWRGGGTLTGYKAEELSDMEKVDLHTKALIGNALFATLLILAIKWDDDEEPWIEITSNGYGDYRKNYNLTELGWQANSFRVKNPVTGEYGTWIGYDLFPSAAPMALVGNIVDAKKYRNYSDADIATLAGFTAGETGMALLNSTALSSLNTTLQWAVNMKDGEKAFESMVKQISRTSKSFGIPNLYTQSFREYQRIWDEPMKETASSTKGLKGALEIIAAEYVRDIPVARNSLYDKINGAGKPIIPDTDRLFSSPKRDPYFELLQSKKAHTDPPSIKTVTVWDKNYVEKFLTRDEYYRFSIARGSIMEAEVLKNLDKFSNMPEDQFKKEWTDIKSYATSAAKEIVVDPKYVPTPRDPIKHLTEEQKKAKFIKARKKKAKPQKKKWVD